MSLHKIILLLGFAAQLSAAPLRIMPLGDSITAGYTDNPTWNVPFESGYRSGLYTLLANAGYDFQFVGASLEPFNNLYGDPTHGGTVSPSLDLRPLGQNGHRGYGGVTISYINDNVAGYIAADNPDIILLMIGINGISTSSPSDLDTLVATIFTAKPSVKLIVAQITPKIDYSADLYNYNTYIRNTLVPKYNGLGRNISTVDQYKNFLTNPSDPTSINRSLYANGINHPDNATYNLMAATWFAGIVAQATSPVIVTGASSSNELSFSNDVSATDLLQGLTGTSAVHSGWNLGNSASPTKLNDGVLGGSDIPVQGAWAASSGSVSTFTLNPGNGNGWDISGITTFAAWLNAGFGNQRYDVSIRRVGESSFTALASVNYEPFTVTGGGGSKVTIHNTNGLLARGVEAIRFTMLATNGNNGGAVYREFDVFGTATPAYQLSILGIEPPVTGSPSMALTWLSRVGKTYRVEMSNSLSAWNLLETTYPSGGVTTTLRRVANPTTEPRAFFRISENP